MEIKEQYVVYRKDFMDTKKYIRGYSITYNLADANIFNTVEDAKQALRNNILKRVDVNLSEETLNKIMSHYTIEAV